MVLNDNEFDDMLEEITYRFARANVDGTLPELLERLGWSSLLPGGADPLLTFPNGKILVIGGQSVGIDKLRMTANKVGLDIGRFEFLLDYEKAQTYNYGDLAYNSKYRVILMGQVPHSTTGTAHSGSVLAELENHPDKYPRVVALRTETGELKITKSNFRKTLEMLMEERYIAA